MQAVYVSSNQFKVSTDKTSEFLAGRRIRANCGGNYKYSTIQSSIYSDPDTTVTIEESILTSNLTEVHYGIVNVGDQGSFPNHSHDGNEGTGGGLSLLTLSDTPTTYSGTERYYLKTTGSGIEFSEEVNPYWSSVEPFLDENSANVSNKPTLVTRGVFSGYSLPEYATGEELSFRMRVPFRWDGSTNPWFVAITSISTAEDIGDKYRFQFEWNSRDIENVIPDNIQETLTYEVTVTSGIAYYAEIIAFELDSTTIVSGQNLQSRLRRIAATSSSVSNEVIVWHWCTRWRMNKLGTESIQGY